MRSKGVKKWRRLAFDAVRGPSAGNFAFDAAFVNVLTFVIPLSRDEKTYEPATLIGPEMLFTSKRPVLLTTCATVKRWCDHFFMWRLLRQRKSWLLPVVIGREFASDGGARGSTV